MTALTTLRSYVKERPRDNLLAAAQVRRDNEMLGLHSPLTTTPRKPRYLERYSNYVIITEARRTPKVTEQETIHATAEQQQEMERLFSSDLR